MGDQSETHDHDRDRAFHHYLDIVRRLGPERAALFAGEKFITQQTINAGLERGKGYAALEPEVFASSGYLAGMAVALHHPEYALALLRHAFPDGQADHEAARIVLEFAPLVSVGSDPGDEATPPRP